MPTGLDNRTIRSKQVIRQTAHLRTSPAVGTAPHSKLTGLTVAAVADAQSSVNKNLKRHVDSFGNSFYLGDIKLARQHKLRESGTGKTASLCHFAYVALRTGM